MKCRKTALVQGFICCHECGCLSKITDKQINCTLCSSVLHPRVTNSFQRTAALLLSGFCLYIPANIFPIMTYTTLGVGEPHTIVGGIISLIQGDMVPIAMLVLVASILVPLLKLLGISLLLLNVHFRWQNHARKWTMIYRIITFVGRWSMLDVFIISILVALVDMGDVAKVIAGPAATAFAAVVVLTMLAAKNFDPRLLWDKQH